ncbi:MAG: LTA synthase family protein [Candidatus Zixiibacteriota bacterium]
MPNLSQINPASIKGWLPGRPFVLLFFTNILIVALFACLRALFLLMNFQRISGASLFDIATAFGIGYRFDQAVAMYLLSVPILIIPWLSLNKSMIRHFVAGFLTAVISLSLLISLSDIRFFSYFDSHLNFLATEYLDEGPTAWNLIFSDKWAFWFIALWLLVSVGLWASLKAMFSRLSSLPHRYSWTNQIIWFLIASSLVVIGIRGRVGLSPINWGMAYFSDSPFVNELALNGVFTLGRTMAETNGDPRLSYLDESERFAFVQREQALATARSMLWQNGQEWLDSNSVRRHSRSGPGPLNYQPNVIIVVMESWAGMNTGTLGETRNLTPNFDTVAAQGLLFTQCFASGIRTSFGLGATLCSFPSLPGRAIMKRYDARHPFVSLPEILAQRGYTNCFAYGGDPVFDNIEGFFREQGIERFYDNEFFGRENDFSKWGIPDHVLFDKSGALIDSLTRPFSLTILTLSNHEPWELPDSSVRRYSDDSDSSKIFNSMIYADWALGRLIDSLKARSVYDSTILVFVSDHNRLVDSRYLIVPNTFHIPLLFLAPPELLEKSRMSDFVCSQTDILPTVMGLLGGDYIHQSWGRDLLNISDGDSGYAIVNRHDRIGYIDRSYFYFETEALHPKLIDRATMQLIPDTSTGFRDLFDSRQRRLRHYMQAADQLTIPVTALRADRY